MARLRKRDRKKNPHPKGRIGRRHRLLLKRLSGASGTVRRTRRGECMAKRLDRDWSFLDYQGQEILKRRKKNPLTRAEVAKVLRAARRWATHARWAGSIGDVRERHHALGYGRGALDSLLGVASDYGKRRWWTYRARGAAAGRRGKGVTRFYRDAIGARKNPCRRRKKNPLTRAESARLIWWSRWLRTAARTMRGKPGVTVKDIAFQRGEAHEAARIARAYGKAGRLRPDAKKLRATIRKSIKKKNPLLQVVGLPARLALGNPFDPATLAMYAAGGVGAGLAREAAEAIFKRNPRHVSATRGQRIKSAQIVPFSVARRLVGSADYARAAKGFRSFHGLSPLHAVRVRLDDGSRKFTRRAVFEVGEAPSIEYRTRRHSRKHADKSGRRILWTHKFSRKKPVWVHDPKSGITSLLGSAHRIGKQKGHGNLSWFLR